MKKDTSNILMIALIVALGLACSVAGVAVFMLKSGQSFKAGKEIARESTTQVSIGEIVVNLADTNAMRYLKTDLVLEVKGDIGESEQNDAKTRVRDAVIDVLSSKRYAELTKTDGKAQLKKQLLAVVNQRLKNSKATNVFFNEFAMQ